MRAEPETRRRAGRWLIACLTLVLVAGAAFWAGRVTLREPEGVPTSDASSVVVTVTEQTVGKVLRYNVTVTRSRTPVAVNTLAGVVTRAGASGTFDVGGVLYAVDAVPVRVVAGTFPFYRDLARGARGQDVAQLRTALHRLGHLSAAAGSAYDDATVRAVERWQRALGLSVTGTIRRGELVAVPQLPTSLALDSAVLRVGGVLAGGETVVFRHAGEPRFSLQLGNTEASQVPLDATITITHQQSTWQARITDTKQLQDASTEFTLAAPDGGTVCGKQCGTLPAGVETIYLLSSVSIVPAVSGPGVPVAAVITKPDGSTVVMVVGQDDSRTERPVTVKGSQDGIAVVEGLRVGERVQVFGSTPATPGATPNGTSSPR